MGRIYRRSIAATQPGVTAVLIGIACPDNSEMEVSLNICNDSTTAKYFTLYKVPSGGTAGVTNLLANQKVVGSQEDYSCPQLDGNVFGPGEALYASEETAEFLTFSGGYVVIER